MDQKGRGLHFRLLAGTRSGTAEDGYALAARSVSVAGRRHGRRPVRTDCDHGAVMPTPLPETCVAIAV